MGDFDMNNDFQLAGVILFPVKEIAYNYQFETLIMGFYFIKKKESI